MIFINGYTKRYLRNIKLFLAGIFMRLAVVKGVGESIRCPALEGLL
jgi:hypothetical protein